MGQAAKDQHKIRGVEMARPKKVKNIDVVVGETYFRDVAIDSVVVQKNEGQEGGWKVDRVTAEGLGTQMNEYAARVWAGQSVDLPKSERIHRVKEALKGQGYTDNDLQELRISNA